MKCIYFCQYFYAIIQLLNFYLHILNWKKKKLSLLSEKLTLCRQFNYKVRNEVLIFFPHENWNVITIQKWISIVINETLEVKIKNMYKIPSNSWHCVKGRRVSKNKKNWEIIFFFFLSPSEGEGSLNDKTLLYMKSVSSWKRNLYSFTAFLNSL